MISEKEISLREKIKQLTKVETLVRQVKQNLLSNGIYAPEQIMKDYNKFKQFEDLIRGIKQDKIHELRELTHAEALKPITL